MTTTMKYTGYKTRIFQKQLTRHLPIPNIEQMREC